MQYEIKTKQWMFINLLIRIINARQICAKDSFLLAPKKCRMQKGASQYMTKDIHFPCLLMYIFCSFVGFERRIILQITKIADKQPK